MTTLEERVAQAIAFALAVNNDLPSPVSGATSSPTRSTPANCQRGTRTGTSRLSTSRTWRGSFGQIPTVYEYSVERGTRTFDDGPYVWTPWDGPYERQETAERMAADRRRPGVDVKYRVSRSPAPAWTPVEDLS